MICSPFIENVCKNVCLTYKYLLYYVIGNSFFNLTVYSLLIKNKSINFFFKLCIFLCLVKDINLRNLGNQNKVFKKCSKINK